MPSFFNIEKKKMEFNIDSPFSFGLGEDLFPLPSLSPSIDIPPILDQNNLNTISKEPKKKGRRKNPPAAASNSNGIAVDIESPNDQKKKKIIHRDVERQRRQEISSLYSDLRSFVPLEYLKGKRSISDQIEQTVKYIQHMENQIQQLFIKRDELKKVSHKNVGAASSVQTLSSSNNDSMVVRAKTGSGVQVVVDTGTQNMNLMSNILQALTVDGFVILSCISTKINERFLHTIECQAVHDGTIDVSELQNKLMNLEY